MPIYTRQTKLSNGRTGAALLPEELQPDGTWKDITADHVSMLDTDAGIAKIGTRGDETSRSGTFRVKERETGTINPSVA